MKEVDGVLIDWGERWDWATQRAAKIVPRQAAIRISIPSSKKSNAYNPRDRVNAIIKKLPQAVLKITGGARGPETQRVVAAHLRYIARHGRVELEDEQGNIYSGKEDLSEAIDSIEQGGGGVIPPQSEKRETFNIVLSAPPGSDRLAVKRAAQAFSKSQFEGAQWMLAHHDDTQHPHAHLMVKAVQLNGKRLNPRKAQLHEWRAKWAMELRENGVMVDATPRAARLQRAAGMTLQQRYMREKGIEGTPNPSDPERRAQARATRREAIRDLWAIHEALKKTGRKSDLAQARNLANYLKKRGAYDYRTERHAAVAVDAATGHAAAGGLRVRSLSERSLARPGVWTREGILPSDARHDVQR